MSDPVLHVLAGPNGSGKSTFYRELLGPTTGLRFINADEIAAARWPGAEVEHGHDASEIAAAERAEAINQRQSFITETVFSHPSKTELVHEAKAAGYRVALHIILIPEELAVARVENRVNLGGHDVPEDKIRGRYARLWANVSESIKACDEAFVYDNSRASEPFVPVASFASGRIVGTAKWPAWTPNEIMLAGRN